MKKQLLILTAILCATPTVAKVTYEDALASSADYYNHLKAVNKAPDDRGLREFELQVDDAANQMGKWVKISNSETNISNAGDYASILAPTSAGTPCLKGDKGLIMRQFRYCSDYNSKHNTCDGYSYELGNGGYKAECK